ncbi:FAD-linked oxidase C-terminal domain-containing protein [Polaromonas sp.]|uniref:FAD-linked oxidase C-terminal domain-containing protein n=1 Tax=Polaromonas sp. TaxID=1869339 RepID=UPI003C932A45
MGRTPADISRCQDSRASQSPRVFHTNGCFKQSKASSLDLHYPIYAEIELMRSLKNLLDPAHILNAGRVF